MSDPNLADRVAIVTGGSHGIGRATALALAHAGARVAIADRRLDDANDQPYADHGIEQHECDVRSVADLQRVVDGVAERHGRLDLLVNNAGIGLVKPIDDVTESEWDDVLDTNLKAAFFAAKFAIPHMRREGGGAIVNNASNAGLLPRAHDPVYSISKMSLVALTKSLALCHSVDRIRVNCVCPGPVGGTRMFESELALHDDVEATRQKYVAAAPLAHAHGRTIDPDEVAAAIVYLCSDAACMVTGTAIAIDGGKSLGVPPSAR